MTPIKDLSINPFEFIRQCQEDLHMVSKEAIAEQAWVNGSEFAGRVLHILSKVGSAEMAFLQVQRRMIRDLAKEMLGKILYTQKEFAGKLIATMEEFGVGVAFVESDVAYFGTVWVYTVTSYTPEGWGIRQTFNSDDDENARETAYRLAENINNFGNFSL